MKTKKLIIICAALTLLLSLLPITRIAEAGYTEEGIFLNGESGDDDSNDGLSKDAPVKTFEKAKDLLSKKNKDTIFVTGAVTVSNTDSFTLDDKYKMVRSKDYDGNLIIVAGYNGDLTLKNITIDGSSEQGFKAVKSLIQVKNGGSLTLEDGAVLQNNSLTLDETSKCDCAGGAIYVEGKSSNKPDKTDSGVLTMNGGIIQNCSAYYGSGVYCAGKFTLSGGKIINNGFADWEPNKSTTTETGTYGGGVMINGCGDDQMVLENGTISGNKAYSGGGIAVGTSEKTVAEDETLWNTHSHSTNLTNYGCLVGTNKEKADDTDMGTVNINKNTAFGSGGGIFLGYNRDIWFVNYCNPIHIEDNECLGYEHNGGGGIYASKNSKVSFQSALIANNTAATGGGGIYDTYTSRTEPESELLIYQNTAKGKQDDILISGTNESGNEVGFKGKSRSVPIYLPDNTTSYSWKYTDTGEYVGINYLEYLMQSIADSNIFTTPLHIYNDWTDDDETIKEVKKSTRVFIQGNSSKTYGGGITNDGILKQYNLYGATKYRNRDLYFVNCNVTLKWEDDNNAQNLRPDTLRLWVLRDGKKFVCYELSKKQILNTDKDGVTVTIDELPMKKSDDNNFSYTMELEAQDLTGKYKSEGKQIGEPSEVQTYIKMTGEYEVTLTYNWNLTNTLATGNLEVSKTVTGENADKTKEFSFKVTLDDTNVDGKYGHMTFKDGVATFKLSDGESVTATGIPASIGYTVEELNSDGYDVTINGQKEQKTEGTIGADETHKIEFKNTKKITTPTPASEPELNKGEPKSTNTPDVPAPVSDDDEDKSTSTPEVTAPVSDKDNPSSTNTPDVTTPVSDKDNPKSTSTPEVTAPVVTNSKPTATPKHTSSKKSNSSNSNSSSSGSLSSSKKSSTSSSASSKNSSGSNNNTGTSGGNAESSNESPDTGDSSNVNLYFLIMLVAGLGIAGSAVYNKRR